MNIQHNLCVCNLKALSGPEIEALGQLEISEWQEIKGGSFKESIEAWQNGENDHVLGLCFLLDSRPVGMTLFKRPPLSPSCVPAGAATIHGLKISQSWQGQGLGHKAFGLAVDALKKEWSEVTELMLAVDADNTHSIAIYRAFGMTEYEPIREGNNGLEYRFQVSI